jgi:hypothetical protein
MFNGTILSLRRNSSQRTRIETKAAAVVVAMRNGEALHLHQDRHGRSWWLSRKGTRVTDEIAQIVIRNPDVVAAGDTLPLGADLPAQTWRYPNRGRLAP